MGVLEVEAPALPAAEQGFHRPAVGLGLDGTGLGCAGTGDAQEVAVLQAQRGQGDEATPDWASDWQATALAGLERTEPLIQAHHAVPSVGHAGIALQPLVEWEALALPPAEPVAADKCAD